MCPLFEAQIPEPRGSEGYLSTKPAQLWGLVNHFKGMY